jgi:hypothetical protein
MPKLKKPQIIITENTYGPPQYTPAELEGLKEQALRLSKHIEILEEEVKSKRAQLVGIEQIILDNS